MQHDIKWVETPKQEKLSRYEQLKKSVSSEDYVKYIGKMPPPPREEPKRQVFHYHCWFCGEAIDMELLSHYKARVFCPECKEGHEAGKQEMLDKYILLKKHVMHERALRMLEKQEAVMELYKEASDVVLERALKQTDAFQSSHEMIAAMELLRNCVYIKLQHKVGKHRVDFALPELKVVLEIDGFMHGYQTKKDSKRDIAVRQVLGEEWEVVRIPTKYMEQSAPLLLDAIYGIYEFKQKTRVENSGILPEWYSKREKDHFKKFL